MINAVDFEPTPPFEEELKLVDKDIADIYRGKPYFLGTPFLAQLARELKLLRLELERQRGTNSED